MKKKKKRAVLAKNYGFSMILGIFFDQSLAILGTVPEKFPYQLAGTRVVSREIPVPAGGYGNSPGSSLSVPGAKPAVIATRDTTLCSTTPRDPEGVGGFGFIFIVKTNL